MANYREDSQETAVASDSTWGRMTVFAEDAVKASSALLFGLMISISDSAIASDELTGKSIAVTSDVVQVAELYSGQLKANTLTIDPVKVSEKYTGRIQVLLSDQAAISESYSDNTTSILTDTAKITDSLVVSRIQPAALLDTAKISDSAPRIVSTLDADILQANDSFTGSLTATSLLIDSAQIGDSFTDSTRLPSILVDGAKIQDEAFGTLYARSLSIEIAVIEDEPLGMGGLTGQAWTASTDSWGMSRYAPYTFQSIAVIDGVLYGMTDDGVYRLDSEQQTIAGHIATGKLDLGKGALTHPLGAYLEYELSGSSKQLQMDVTTTQSGAAQTYSYVMPNELADELTNGRVIFGRGLRGRHFTLSLRMTGERGYINDLNVETASTKRRV